MRPTTIWIGVLGFVILLSGPATPAQAQVTLRYKFTKGDKLDYVMEQKATMKMSVNGMDIKMETNQTLDLSWNILSVDSDGNAKVVQKVERFRFTMDSPQGNMEYDSKDGKVPEGPAGEMIGPLFKAYGKLEMSVTIDPQGGIKDTKMPEEFIKQLKELKVPALGQMLSEDSVKQIPNQLTLALPKDAIRKGEKWAQEIESKTAVGKSTLKYTYTLEDEVTRDGKKLTKMSITPTTKIESDPNAPFGIKVKGGEGKGTAFFDNQAGRFVEYSVTQDADLELSVGGMMIDQAVTTVTTVKLQDKK
jgi:hypothetical protein